MDLEVRGIGLVAPGLSDWKAALPVLRGECAYQAEPLGRLAPARLASAERRRATAVTRLAITAAGEALGEANPAEIPAVFASSEGDLVTTDDLCRTMNADPPWVSPMRFHNAVHNAAVGYWSIAVGVQANTTSLCAYDETFSSGLLEAAAQLAADEIEECLLVAYDDLVPEPLRASRPISQPFAVALRLARRGGGAALRVSLKSGTVEESVMDDDGLERLRTNNPAARSLPLLVLLAGSTAGAVRLVCPGGHLRVERPEGAE